MEKQLRELGEKNSGSSENNDKWLAPCRAVNAMQGVSAWPKIKLLISFHFAALHFFAARIFISSAARQQSKRNFCPAWLCSLCGELPLPPLLLFHQANVRPWRWFWISLQAPGVGLTFCKTQAFGNCCSCKIRRWNRISCSFSSVCCPFFWIYIWFFYADMVKWFW